MGYLMRILSEKEVSEKVGSYSRVSRWRWERAGLFPARVKVGLRRVGWFEHEIDEWLASRPRVTKTEAGTS